MATALVPVGEFIAGLFSSGAGAGAAAGAGEAAAAGGTAAAASGATSAAIAAGGYSAVGGGIAAGAGTTAAAAGGAAVGAGAATTIAEASAIATGASALYTLSQGPGRISIPPMPMQANVDQTVANAEQAERQRLAAAGGLQSTIGTGPGQAGATLNPATLSSHSLLGA